MDGHRFAATQVLHLSAQSRAKRERVMVNTNIRTHEGPRRGATPASLSDENAAQIMIGLRAGSTLRRFTLETDDKQQICSL
jgi:hypothetical protein